MAFLLQFFLASHLLQNRTQVVCTSSPHTDIWTLLMFTQQVLPNLQNLVMSRAYWDQFFLFSWGGWAQHHWSFQAMEGGSRQICISKRSRNKKNQVFKNENKNSQMFHLVHFAQLQFTFPTEREHLWQRFKFPPHLVWIFFLNILYIGQTIQVFPPPFQVIMTHCKGATTFFSTTASLEVIYTTATDDWVKKELGSFESH